MERVLVAVVVGHRPGSPGAVNQTSGVSEFEYNDDVANALCDALKLHDLEPVLVYRDTYQELPNKINALAPDFIISLHCNSFSDTTVSGSEVLYYHTSTNSKALASIVQSKVTQALGLNDRGIKSCTSEDRGGYLLRYTSAPCVIVEPAFISNDSDFSILNEKKCQYVQALVAAAHAYATEYVLL